MRIYGNVKWWITNGWILPSGELGPGSGLEYVCEWRGAIVGTETILYIYISFNCNSPLSVVHQFSNPTKMTNIETGLKIAKTLRCPH